MPIAYSSPTPNVTASRDGAVGWLVLNKPERRNALDAQMWEAIPKLVAAMTEDPDVRVIAVTGAGEEAFAAGADISEFKGNRDDAAGARAYEEMNGRAFRALQETPKPVVAVIRGFCIGGGLAIALSCDLRIASDDAQFALPPARLGLAYPAGGIATLLSAVTPATARDLIFTGRRVDAQEALRLGLVNRVVAKDALTGEATAVLRSIAENAPLTIAAAKRTIAALHEGMSETAHREIETLAARCFDSADYKEGRAAFLEKRKPQFRGV
ncbi:MAG: enoyl-CoA hydratase [Hyphomicrobiales bacterium]